MASISCQHIYKIYPGATAPSVTDFNLEIQDKEFIIFVGPSGCGKSTTLRMIAGLEEISKGEMYIGGRLINDVPPKDRDIAMVFQSYALYPNMTVYENMAFTLELKKVPKDEIDRKQKQTADGCKIAEALSSGQIPHRPANDQIDHNAAKKGDELLAHFLRVIGSNDGESDGTKEKRQRFHLVTAAVHQLQSEKEEPFHGNQSGKTQHRRGHLPCIEMGNELEGRKKLEKCQEKERQTR